ncbi:hypothetical protein [Serratia plymuthica]|uniref:hypothetical protein n=1 Tax=Serratia plymuthica TaxID=82996 RepID=UPI00148C40B9|nr:hypothetical protein [Serratia plymuthica]
MVLLRYYLLPFFGWNLKRNGIFLPVPAWPAPRFCARQPLRCRFAHRFLPHIGMNIKHYQSDRNAGELMVGDWSVVYCDDRLCTFGFWFIFQWESEAPRSILLVSKHFSTLQKCKNPP